MQTFLLRICGVLALISLLSPAVLTAQSTAGYSVQRTHLNPDAGVLEPPLEVVRSLPLPEGFSAGTFSVRNGFLVIGEGGPVTRYLLLEEASGLVHWTANLPGSPGPLRYAPAFGTNLVLLGSSATSTVTAVELATGIELWQDDIVGSASGRHPFLTPGLALYHGSRSLAAVNPETGLAFWRFPATSSNEEIATARAPISAYGDQVYLLQAEGTLRALSLITGETRWITFGAGNHGSNPIPTADAIFLQNAVSEAINAIEPGTGAYLWTQPVDGSFAEPGLAYAYGRLYAFLSRDGEAVVAAYDPASGELLWEYADRADAPGAAQSGQLADNLIYFYNPGSGRVRVLDAFTGTLRWSRYEPGVLAMAVDRGGLYLLFANEVRIYEAVHVIYLPHLADGGGASTLFAIINLGPETAVGELQFIGSDGLPLPLAVEGIEGAQEVVPFAIPPASSLKVQTAGLSDELTSGWARASASQPIRGTSVFQASDGTDILFEAGVADAPAAHLAGLLVSRVSRNPANPFSTGVAIANPGDEPALVTLHFLRTVPEPGNFVTTLTLEPGAHVARFLEELFEGEAETGVEGTLVITADIPVVVTALRTQRGFQMSSYPVGVPIR